MSSNISRGDLLALRGKCFAGYVNVPGVAGDFALIELWNPAASGVLLLARSIVVTTATAANSGAGFTTTQNPTAAATPPQNKYAGGAAPVGQILWNNAAAQDGNLKQMWAFATAVDTSFALPFSDPLIIPPGFGLQVQCGQVDVTMWAAFDWEEVAG